MFNMVAFKRLLFEAAAFPPGMSACLGLLGPSGGETCWGGTWNGWRPTLLNTIPDIHVSSCIYIDIDIYIYVCIYSSIDMWIF